MKKTIIPIVALIAMSITASTAQSIQNITNGILNGASGSNTSGTGKSPLSNDEVVRGLKDALTVGTNNSTGLASKLDGYYKNPKLFIPFPKEAKDVKDKVDALGMKSQTDKFVMNLNRAAEEAAKSAAPVFISAVKGMTITDGFSILKGGDNAATTYLKNKTTDQLKQQFTPIVKAALDKVQITKYWNPIIKKYNKIPMVKKQNPDLTAYVTDRAIAGLFVLLAEEELKIRKDPAARVTDILQKVFSSVF
jgi:hypothetical protein